MRFEGQLVHLSVSDSPDLAVMGLSERHLHDAMGVLARMLLSRGLRIGYGGDFRPGGFTDILAEQVLTHGREAVDVADAPVRLYLSGSKLRTIDQDELAERQRALAGLVDLVRLDDEGNDARPGRTPHSMDIAVSLTGMRRRMARDGAARIVAGGQVDGYGGVMPGVAEEALMTLQLHRPLYAIGAYGGCAGDILASLGLAERVPGTDRHWPGLDRFEALQDVYADNGLNAEHYVRLALTPHIEEAAYLVLRGLRKRLGTMPQ